MGWLAASITLLGLIYFAINYPGFRRGLGKGLAIAAAIAVAVAGVAWVMTQRDNERYAAKQSLAKSVIGKNEIVISDARLSIGIYSNVAGVVKNQSSYPLVSFTLKVTVTDCERLTPQPSKDGSDPPVGKKRYTTQEVFDINPPSSLDAQPCGIIGQSSANVYVEVPPGQKRAFESYGVTFSNLPKVDKWTWFYAIEDITAKID